MSPLPRFSGLARIGAALLTCALPAIAPSTAAAQTMVGTTRVRSPSTTLHARCDPGSRVRGVLARGTEVEIEGVSEGWTHVRVPASDERGCLRRADLEPVAALERAETAQRDRERARNRADTAGTAAGPARFTPTTGRALRVSAFGLAGTFSPTASKSFEAILDRASGREVGAGAQIAFQRGGLRGLFVEAGGSRFREDGERVFVSGDDVIRLGIPVTIELTPIELTAGYRYVFGRRSRTGAQTASPIVPFAGAGMGSLRYRETSDFAEDNENVSERFTSYHLMGGIEVSFLKVLVVGAEARHRWVPDGLGTGGVSKEFNETDLGGTTFRVRVGVAF